MSALITAVIDERPHLWVRRPRYEDTGNALATETDKLNERARTINFTEQRSDTKETKSG